MDMISKKSIDMYSKLIENLPLTKAKGIVVHILAFLLGGIISQFGTMIATRGKRSEVRELTKDIEDKEAVRESQEKDLNEQQNTLTDLQNKSKTLQDQYDKIKQTKPQRWIELEEEMSVMQSKIDSLSQNETLKNMNRLKTVIRTMKNQIHETRREHNIIATELKEYTQQELEKINVQYKELEAELQKRQNKK